MPSSSFEYVRAQCATACRSKPWRLAGLLVAVGAAASLGGASLRSHAPNASLDRLVQRCELEMLRGTCRVQTGPDQGFWPCNNDIYDDRTSKTQTYSGFVMADVGIAGLFAPNPLVFTDSAFIGRSSGNPTPAVGYRGVNLYDAGYSLAKLHFANYADTDGGAFGMAWGNRSRTITHISGMTR